MDTLLQYEIIVEGRLDVRWAEWFMPLQISFPNPTQTCLSGALNDQAALLGLLRKLHDLGLGFLSIRRVPLVTASVRSDTYEHS